MVPWIPEWEHFDAQQSSRETGRVLKELAKWEIKASETTIFEYNSKPGTGLLKCWILNLAISRKAS